MIKGLIIFVLILLLIGASFYLESRFNVVSKIKNKLDKFSIPKEEPTPIQEEEKTSIYATHSEEFE